MNKSKLLKKGIRFKIYFDRARMYFGYLQFIILLKLFLDSVNIKSNIWIYISLIVFVFFIFGWLDTKYGLRKTEIEDNARQNPVLKEILDKIDNEIIHIRDTKK